MCPSEGRERRVRVRRPGIEGERNYPITLHSFKFAFIFETHSIVVVQYTLPFLLTVLPRT
jgi:hypothetical protein